jgi:glucosamine-6-phosphate deaminase
MRERRPDVVTVALDPEGSGPDTHFKVLQAVAAAVKAAAGDDAPPRVWGYRNVWCRFSAAEAGLIFPVTPSDAAALGALFTACCACGAVCCARAHSARSPHAARRLLPGPGARRSF